MSTVGDSAQPAVPFQGVNDFLFDMVVSSVANIQHLIYTYMIYT